MPDGSRPITNLRRIIAADLFCGAGGTSTGAARACADLGMRLDLTAVNHWPVALETHSAMHPEATHICADLESVRPRGVIPGAHLDLLMASPTCTYHSRARGGRPVHDQQRMDPWHVHRWCTELRVDRLLVENVPEMIQWGPCCTTTGRPIQSRRGEYFRAWLEALRAIGFTLDFRVLNCADYGDPTTRQRFFLIGRTDGRPLRWPEPTHCKGGSADLLRPRAPWRSAAECIDWTTPGRSIFGRKKPLAPNTLRRILAGAERYHWPRPHIDALRALLEGRAPVLDIDAETAAAMPFVIPVTHHGERPVHDLRDPFRTITGANRGELGLVMATASCGAARALDEPIPTVVGGGNGARPHYIQPILTSYYGTSGAGAGIDEPLPTVTTRDRFGIAQPVVVQLSNQSGHQAPRSIGDPLRTITCTRGGDMAMATPILLRAGHGDSDGRDPASRLIDPHSPLPTVTGSNEFAIAEPAVAGYRIDILYRMLTVRELARAMSFDVDGHDYPFAGTATDITKQIGNAVPCRTAQALVRALLESAL